LDDERNARDERKVPVHSCEAGPGENSDRHRVVEKERDNERAVYAQDDTQAQHAKEAGSGQGVRTGNACSMPEIEDGLACESKDRTRTVMTAR